MTFPDRRLERPLDPPEAPNVNTQDVIPANERNQDPERDLMHHLTVETARPLTDDEKKIADRDTPVAERVYAPASERVPKTVPGHLDVVQHIDNDTPERQAISHDTTPGSSPATSTSTNSMTEPMSEPTFTRVARPSQDPGYQPDSGTSFEVPYEPETSRRMWLVPAGIGWGSVVVCGIGVWLFMRWRRERNRPIHRFRRQARRTAAQARDAASQLRGRMGDIEFPDEAGRPAVGVGTGLLTLALLLWQRSQSSHTDVQSRSRDARGRAEKMRRRAAQTVSDTDWQNRLQQLKDRWTPGRIALERKSIPRR